MTVQTVEGLSICRVLLKAHSSAYWEREKKRLFHLLVQLPYAPATATARGRSTNWVFTLGVRDPSAWPLPAASQGVHEQEAGLEADTGLNSRCSRPQPGQAHCCSEFCFPPRP